MPSEHLAVPVLGDKRGVDICSMRGPSPRSGPTGVRIGKMTVPLPDPEAFPRLLRPAQDSTSLTFPPWAPHTRCACH